MYQFNPNFSLMPDYAPAAGTPTAVAIANAGLACGWVQQTDGEKIEISVAQPAPSTLAQLRAAASGEVAPGEYFNSAGSTGTVQIFTGPYWIVATSAYFGAADEATILTDSVKAALR